MRDSSTFLPSRILAFFVAGFISVLTFHQAMRGVLHLAGLTQATSYSMRATSPFGVPMVLSLAFWGGIWGIVLCFIEPRFPHGLAYLASGFLFGAIAPTVVSWFILAPLRGQPVASGFVPANMMVGPIVNGTFG